MSPFLRFFQKGEIKKPNGQYVSITKSIPAPKPIPPPRIDSKTKRIFTKDVPKFFKEEVKPIAVSLGKNFQNAIMMPEKLTSLFNNLATNMNTPLLLPIILLVGTGLVVVHVTKK